VDESLAALVAEKNLRRQHKYRLGWNRADQLDENMWTRHDNNQGLGGEHLVHGMPYGICTVCEYLRKKVRSAHN
jgi:hypothetical protein